MKNERKAFNFLKSYYEAIESMPKKHRARLYEAIIKYSFDDNFSPDFSGDLATFWILIKPNLDNSYKQYLNGKKNTAN